MPIIILLVLAFAVSAYPDSHCRNVQNDVDHLCFPNGTTTGNLGKFNVSYLYEHDAQDESMKLHYPGGDWAYVNPDDLKNFVGGAGRNSFRSYRITIGTPFNGPFIGGGSVYDKTVLPHKIMAVSELFAPFSTRTEYEIIMDRRYLVVRFAVECEDNDDCDTTDGDAFRLKLSSIYGSSQPAYRTNIDSSYAGGAFNISYGSTSYDPARNYTFIVAFNDTPDFYDFSGAEEYFYWNITKDEVKDIIAVVTTSEFESGISDWMDDYDTQHDRVRDYYQAIGEELNYPSNVNATVREAYYWSGYSGATSTVRPWNDSDTSNNLVVNGSSRIVSVPGMETYHGQWPWDAPNVINAHLAAINHSSPHEFFRNLSKDSLAVLVDNEDAYPTVGSFNPVYQYGTGAAQDGNEWVPAVLGMWEAGMIEESYLTNSVYPVLKSSWYYLHDNHLGSNWLCDRGGGALGGDASDVYASGGDNVMCTGLFGISTLGMKRLANITGNSADQAFFDSAYTNITGDIEDLWNSSAQIYWNHDSGGDFYVEDDAATDLERAQSMQANPMGLANILALNASSASQVSAVIEHLEYNFSDTYGFTSIPTKHACYDPNGDSVSGCEGGGRWDGAWWSPDATYPHYAFTYMRDTLGDSSVQNILHFIHNNSVDIYLAANTVHGSESYDSNDATVNDGNLWGINPYGWGNWLLVILNPDYNLYGFLANGTSGSNVSGGSPAANATLINWTDRFNWVNTNQSDGMGVLHRSTLSGSMYLEVENFVHAYIDMYRATGDTTYLNYTTQHLDNITARWSEWGTMDAGDFRFGHMLGTYAEAAYWLQEQTGTPLADKGIEYEAFAINNISPKIDPYYLNFTYNGDKIGVLGDHPAGTGFNSVKPYNQWKGYMFGELYLYNLTGQEIYYNRSYYLYKGYNTTISTGTCEYDAGRTCNNQSYRFNYSQSWENYSSSFGFPPHEEVINYGAQHFDFLYRLWLHGIAGTQDMDRWANTLYHDMYVQEGGFTNVLFSDHFGKAATTFADFHDFYATHHTYGAAYFDFWQSDLSNLTEKVANKTYGFVDDGDSTYTYFIKPYESITDPRTSQAGVYTVDDYSNVTSDQVLRLISAYQLSELSGYSTQILFPQPETFSSSSGGGGTPTPSTLTETEQAYIAAFGIIASFMVIAALIVIINAFIRVNRGEDVDFKDIMKKAAVLVGVAIISLMGTAFVIGIANAT